MITTFLSDNELNIPTSDKVVNEVLDEVRRMTGENWQVLERTVEVYVPWYLFWKRAKYVKVFDLYCYVGGCGPWQVINFYQSDSATSINTCATADLVVAYLYGIQAGCLHAKKGNKMTRSECEALFKLASSNAREATEQMLKDNPDVWYPCGFAWVRIKPARGPFVAYLKEIGSGITSSDGGYVVYNPSGNSTQWMDAKFAGAKAFAKILTDAGIRAFAESRID